MFIEAFTTIGPITSESTLLARWYDVGFNKFLDISAIVVFIAEKKEFPKLV